MLRRAVAIALTVVLAALLAACGGSSATPSGGGGFLVVRDAWSRAAPSGGTSAAYFTITNGQLVDDAITGASSPVATSAGVHETTTDSSGMMGMHEVASVPIPAGSTVTFQPGGYHVMLMGLKQELKTGDRVELQLTTSRSGTIRVIAEVRAG
jgi:copper(I)-binding protein